MPQEKLNAKPAGKGIAIPWHQDWAFFPHTNDSVVTASVLIDDSSRENGTFLSMGFQRWPSEQTFFRLGYVHTPP